MNVNKSGEGRFARVQLWGPIPLETIAPSRR